MPSQKILEKGNHLVLDGSSKENLKDEQKIKQILLKITRKLKLDQTSDPIIVKIEEPEECITGTVLLKQSSITIHTYPKKRWICLDIYSNEEFNTNKTLKFLIKELKIVKFKKQVLKRGFYPELN